MDCRKLIGIFAVDVASRVQCNFYKELHETAEKTGYNLVLFSGIHDRIDFNKTDVVSNSLFDMAEVMDFAAIIIHAQSLGRADIIHSLIEMGRKKNIPVFVYDCEGIKIQQSEGVILINLDYKQGFAESVKHLIEYHNCKNIFMLAGIRGNQYSEDRIEMFRKEMAAHGLEIREGQIDYGDFWEIPTVDAVNRFLDSELPTPEAICCANDSMAIAAAKVLRQRGYRVPEDILVTGFDGIEDGKYNLPVISTCEPRLEVVTDFIFRVIEGKSEETEFLIPLKFYPKESCGCHYCDTLEDKKEIARLVENTRQNSWQHHMLTTMQFELMDSTELNDSTDYMQGILNFFDGYSYLFCVRENLEYADNYETSFEQMRIHLNAGFLSTKEYEPFSRDEIVPKSEAVFTESPSGSVFIFHLIHSASKKYGYAILRTNRINSNEIKLHGQFVESATNVIEGILRNRRLKIANQRLSEMYEKMSEIHIRDTMTGLYNRNGYYQVLNEYLAREDLKEGYLHIISIDMDNMKGINDNYGHLEGDLAIKAVASAIADCFKHPCVCARFGGDEFEVAIFTGAPEEPHTEKIAWKLNSYLNSTEKLEDKEYKVEVSVGQAVIRILDIEDLKIVEKMADDAMYQNKRQRKNKQAD